MNYTENYELNQWEPSDRVLREDFNADNAKIDAALPQFTLYEYSGTGAYGVNTPNTITFPKRPLLVLLFAPQYMAAVPGFLDTHTGNVFTTSNSSQNTYTWSENTLSWYNVNSATYQFNLSDVTYRCLAVFAPSKTVSEA